MSLIKVTDQLIVKLALLPLVTGLAMYSIRRFAAGGRCNATPDLTGRYAIITGTYPPFLLPPHSLLALRSLLTSLPLLPFLN